MRYNKSRYFMLALILSLTLLSACQGEPAPVEPIDPIVPPNGENTVPPEEQPHYTVEDAFPDLHFERPLALEHARDDSGRLFVVEQSGKIYVLSDTEATEAELFLDISHRVDDRGNEMGLLGLAFHPDFAQNGYFFVNYTDRDETVIARFSLEDNLETADPNSEEQLLTIEQPFTNHNGGQLAFGPDGYLYIATGDGGSSGDPHGHAQNRQTLLGNILRIDVDNHDEQMNYAIPADNPYIDNTRGFREEIFAYGLRNPWRFSFDEPTGRLWVADVGQNRVEEINIITKGKNYGWNIMEGSLCYDPETECETYGLEIPIHEYPHSIGRSITGGYVYRGNNHPELEGTYIYGDFVSGIIWALHYDGESDPDNTTLAETNLQISSFGVSEDNELYLTAFNGKIYRLVLQY